MSTNNIKPNILIKKSEKGFAVLFAILIASFLITLGVSIFSISLKEIQITGSVRDSQIAYYAADSARECALYWDVKVGSFPACLDSSCSDYPTSNPVSKTITCNGIPFTLIFNKSSNGLTFSATSTIGNTTPFFQYSSTTVSAPVADIILAKTFDTDRVSTTISAYGHNTTIIGRRVERGISTTNN
jgi:hypothetical protein